MVARMFSVALIAVAACELTACSSTSYVVVGQTHPRISPNAVTVYLSPPPKYQEVAILQGDSMNSWHITGQGKMDEAINRMKANAALLGANGIILTGTGDQYTGSIRGASAWARRGSVGAVGASIPLVMKTAQGVAIYVQREEQAQAVPPSPPRTQSAPNVTSGADAIDGASQRVVYEMKAAPQPQPVAGGMPPSVNGREIVVSRDLRAWFGPGGQAQGGLLVTTVEKNGPTARAGIRVGDVITAVDGQATAPYDWANAATLITNGEGETVRLVVLSKK